VKRKIWNASENPKQVGWGGTLGVRCGPLEDDIIIGIV